jgi:hypothetical protein
MRNMFDFAHTTPRLIVGDGVITRASASAAA